MPSLENIVQKVRRFFTTSAIAVVLTTGCGVGGSDNYYSPAPEQPKQQLPCEEGYIRASCSSRFLLKKSNIHGSTIAGESISVALTKDGLRILNIMGSRPASESHPEFRYSTLIALRPDLSEAWRTGEIPQDTIDSLDDPLTPFVVDKNGVAYTIARVYPWGTTRGYVQRVYSISPNGEVVVRYAKLEGERINVIDIDVAPVMREDGIYYAFQGGRLRDHPSNGAYIRKLKNEVPGLDDNVAFDFGMTTDGFPTVWIAGLAGGASGNLVVSVYKYVYGLDRDTPEQMQQQLKAINLNTKEELWSVNLDNYSNYDYTMAYRQQTVIGPEGIAYVVGTIQGDSSYEHKITAVKDGSILWKNTIQTDEGCSGCSIVALVGNHLYVHFRWPNAAYQSSTLTALDLYNGNTIWTLDPKKINERIDKCDGEGDYSQSLYLDDVVLGGDVIYAQGYTLGSGYSADFFVALNPSSGEVKWGVRRSCKYDDPSLYHCLDTMSSSLAFMYDDQLIIPCLAHNGVSGQSSYYAELQLGGLNLAALPRYAWPIRYHDSSHTNNVETPLH